ncbi:MAG: hypothetical protein NT170_04675 [Candidatus Moranbacteria bacterium]|nr:hypothetical protein [Candidatus Moranbacteria bacterium]
MWTIIETLLNVFLAFFASIFLWIYRDYADQKYPEWSEFEEYLNHSYKRGFYERGPFIYYCAFALPLKCAKLLMKLIVNYYQKKK